MRPDLGEPGGACAHLWEGMAVDAMTNDFGEVLLWSFWFFIWIAALMVWFRCLFDLFADHTLSGWGKAGWALLLIFVPWLGALIYLIARGRSMAERQQSRVTEMKTAQDDYIKQVASAPQSPADQIASAKSLLDSGTIDQKDYDAALKHVDQSLAMKEDWFNLWTKAEILAAKGDRKEALALAQKADQLGGKNPQGFFFAADVKKALAEAEAARTDEYLIEPSPDVVLGRLLPHYVAIDLYRAVLEANASEQSARMIAMRNATDNANELIGDLTLVYNKTRQATITREMIEIASGAEALGG